jgi:hypothetical protein
MRRPRLMTGSLNAIEIAFVKPFYLGMMSLNADSPVSRA